MSPFYKNIETSWRNQSFLAQFQGDLAKKESKLDIHHKEKKSKLRAFNQICGTKTEGKGSLLPWGKLHRAAERTPQSPSHAPFGKADEKLPETHRNNYFWGGDEFPAFLR